MTTRNSAAAMAGACLACLLAGCTSMGGTSGDDNLTDGLDKDQAVFFSSAGGENCASKSVWGALVGGIAGAVIGSSQDSKGALVGALVGASAPPAPASTALSRTTSTTRTAQMPRTTRPTSRQRLPRSTRRTRLLPI